MIDAILVEEKVGVTKMYHFGIHLTVLGWGKSALAVMISQFYHYIYLRLIAFRMQGVPKNVDAASLLAWLGHARQKTEVKGKRGYALNKKFCSN